MSEYGTKLVIQVSPPRQYSEVPDVLTMNVSLHRVCLAVIGRLNYIVYSQGNYLRQSPRTPRLNHTPLGERLFADPPNSPCTHTTPTLQTTLYSCPDLGGWSGDGVLGVQMSRGQRFPASDTRTDSRLEDSPPLGSHLRLWRGVAAPPLVSLPPSKPAAVHRSPNWYAPSNLTVTSEGLMLRYQVEQTCRYWS